MNRILWNGQSAMNANQIRLDAISNNIANMATTGYKRVDINFNEAMSENLDRRGMPKTERAAHIGTGVIAGGTSKEFYQGVLMETGLATDLALEGRSMFKVVGSNGQELYTRAGSFTLNLEGDIVDSAGNMLEVEYTDEYLDLKRNGSLSLQKGNFQITQDGEIQLLNDKKTINVGKIPLYSAEGTDPYISVGSNMFVPKAGAVMMETRDTIMHQGLLEASNVDIGQEFSDMIMTQRAFQLGSKSITTADEMWGMVNNLRSK